MSIPLPSLPSTYPRTYLYNTYIVYIYKYVYWICLMISDTVQVAPGLEFFAGLQSKQLLATYLTETAAVSVISLSPFCRCHLQLD